MTRQCKSIIYSNQDSPIWINDESCNKEDHTKQNEEEVAQALGLGVVGQLCCLLKRKAYRFQR